LLRATACENTESPAGDPDKEQDLDASLASLADDTPRDAAAPVAAPSTTVMNTPTPNPSPQGGGGFGGGDAKFPSPLRGGVRGGGTEAKDLSANKDNLSAITIVVCSSCRDETGSDAHPRAGHLLGIATQDAAAGTDIKVRQVECLGNCKRRLSAALLRDGCWSYVFGDLTLGSGPDLVAGARLFAGSTDGLIPWRGRPDSLKRGLVARIPPLDQLKDIA
jgi:predicted metal-binding protein